MRKNGISAATISLVIFVTLSLPTGAFAHCDGLDGPVVQAAKKALETGNVNLVLIWVQKQDEAAIRDTFQKTLAVRKLGPEAKELADLHFFETLVRLHRAGEGAAYTGLKPAGRDLGPAIPAADEAVAKGSADSLSQLLINAAGKGVLDHFSEVMERRSFALDDVDKGREYVKAYVEFVHYVERLYEATQKPAHGHDPEPGETDIHS